MESCLHRFSGTYLLTGEGGREGLLYIYGEKVTDGLYEKYEKFNLNIT